MTGSDLGRLRKRMGLTQAILAGRILRHVNTVARWERGEVRIVPPMDAMIREACRKEG